LASPYTHDFTRNGAGDATIRVFQGGKGVAAGEPLRIVEVSTAGMVATNIRPYLSPAPAGGFADATAVVLGTAEKSPVILVTALTGSGVTQVRWSGEGAGDAMAPVNGFVALAVPVATAPKDGAAVGTLTATDGSGKVTSTVPLTLPAAITKPPPINCNGVTSMGGTSSTGSGGSSTGSAGASAGSSGPATATAPSPQVMCNGGWCPATSAGAKVKCSTFPPSCMILPNSAANGAKVCSSPPSTRGFTCSSANTLACPAGVPEPAQPTPTNTTSIS
jgi:hypothetical protein